MCDCEETKFSIGTCPECLPAGVIEYLIENGRQLELFGEEGVAKCVKEMTEYEKYVLNPVRKDPKRSAEGLLPF